MAKLNQIIAIEHGLKPRAYATITELNKTVQHPDLFNGVNRTYEKKTEDSEDFPSETKRIQYTVDDVLQKAEKSFTDLINIVARKDWTNCIAKADVKLNGEVFIKDAPVPFLLFLEKQMTDLRTFIGNLPVLDDNENWKKDAISQTYKSDIIKTHKTKKMQRPIVLYNATPEHPAQTQLITEDMIVGHWNTEKTSAAMPKKERQLILDRIEELLAAVREAREEANMAQEVAPTTNIGKDIFAFLLEM